MSRTSDDRFSVLQHVTGPQFRRPRPRLAYRGTHRSAAATRMAAIGSGGCDLDTWCEEGAFYLIVPGTASENRGVKPLIEQP